MGVSKSLVTRVTGITVTPKNFNKGNAQQLPQQLVIIGQGNDDVLYSLEKYECAGSAADVGERYGYGSPLHLAARQLFPTSGAMATFPVYICPVKKANTGFALASGGVLVTGVAATAAADCVLSIGGVDVPLGVAKGTTPALLMADIVTAVNSVQERPVTAELTEATDDDPAEVKLTARWSGALGNRISLSWSGDVPGLSVALTAFADGAGVPAVDAALEQIGEVWATFVLDTFDYKGADGSASVLLDAYEQFGLGRWETLEKRPCLVAHGCTDNYATRTAVSDARKADHINFFVQSTGSAELPFVVGARGLLEIMSVADENPAQNYNGTLSGLKRGAGSVQENVVVRNQSVLKGASTSIPEGSVAALNDTVTFYHPDGEGRHPAWRHVVDAVKLMNIVYNLRLLTERKDVKGAPLVPDAQVTSNPAAIKPSTVRTWFANLAVQLGEAAIISDADFTIKNLVVKIDNENSKRLNYEYPVFVSGNVEVVSGDLYFGQYVQSA